MIILELADVASTNSSKFSTDFGQFSQILSFGYKKLTNNFQRIMFTFIVMVILLFKNNFLIF